MQSLKVPLASKPLPLGDSAPTNGVLPESDSGHCKLLPVPQYVLGAHTLITKGHLGLSQMAPSLVATRTEHSVCNIRAKVVEKKNVSPKNPGEARIL
jgi:hypothetical protein